MRITQPNYTMIPNDLFDHWLPHLGEIVNICAGCHYEFHYLKESKKYRISEDFSTILNGGVK